MTTGPEIETIAHRSGLNVEVRSDESYFTIYRADGTIAGTMHRPRRYGNGMWSVSTTDGIPVMWRGYPDMIGPRTCLIALARTLSERGE